MQSTVIAVPTGKQRDELVHLVKRKYQIKCLEDHTLKVVQDRVHRVQVWKEDKLFVQVTVAVVPVIVNTEQLLGYGANTKIHTDFVKQELIRQIKRMEELSVDRDNTDIRDKLVEGL